MVDTLPARPTRFGPYEIVRVLGRGGMGEVLEGRHCELGARVAIKVVRPGPAADGETVRRLLREGRATAAIRHPNVVTVLDVGLDGERPFLVMEFLDGEDLAHRLEREAPLSVEQTVRLILPIASAIATAHDAGIVHRDLKPSNVVLAQRWAGIEPVVVDFGISRTLGVTHDATTSSRLVAGTPQYMAPEQLRAPSEVTPAVDQYALGALMYHCLTGGTPFWNEDYYELLHSIMTADLVDPSALNPSVPSPLGAIALKALARDPQARFPSVKALGAALLPFADDDEQRRWRSQFALTLDSQASFALARDAGHPARGTWRRPTRMFALLGPVVLVGALVVAKRHPAEVRPLSLALAAGTMASAASAQPSVSTAPATGRDAIEEETPQPPTVAVVAVAAPREPAAAHVPQTRPPRSLAPTTASAAPASSSFAAPVERGTRNIPIVE